VNLEVASTERSAVELDGHFNPMIFQPERREATFIGG